MSEKKCIKCEKGIMEKGFVIDWTIGGAAQSQWAKEISKFFRAPKGKAEKVTTYRCMECGYLESYAEKK